MENLIIGVLKNKCPYCYKGNVFKKSEGIFKIPEMNARCTSCQKQFKGESGYYVGAMYLSYGVAIAIGLALFLICNFILGIESMNVVLGIIISAIVLISYQNYKWSRIIWLKIFPPDN